MVLSPGVCTVTVTDVVPWTPYIFSVAAVGADGGFQQPHESGIVVAIPRASAVGADLLL
jgi:hypothetical protein